MYKYGLSVTTVIAAVLALSAGTASASETLQFGPPEAWVQPVTAVSAPAPEESHATHAVINRSFQAKLIPGGNITYTETMVKLRTSQGLAAGRPTVSWDPKCDTITINKAQILRDGKVIDLLARKQKFVTLRREPDLENAMLDGQLTAILDPDDLEAGDVIDFAFTIHTKIDMLGSRAEGIWEYVGFPTTGAREYRFVLPKDQPLHWRTSDDLPPPIVAQTPETTELTFRLGDYHTPDAPDQAPERFSRLGEVQFSQFSSWSEVSALMAPYYNRAATLLPNSPLKAEAARIRALSDDPKVRAAEALHLVEEKIRYTYIRDNDGGFTPPAADVTWQRRWGDCKAKTVVLVALLRELGITADPTLVDDDEGDGMDRRLPALALFDHIIVRATIGGKVYWLDGTLDTDGSLDDLLPPTQKWTLPVRDGGEELQPMAVAPYDKPQIEVDVQLDASAGLDAPAHAHLDYVRRGHAAFAGNLDWQAMLPEQMDAKMRGYWQKHYKWIDITSTEESFDPRTAEMHYMMDGVAHMKWDKTDDGKYLVYETDGYDLIDNPAAPNRTPGPHADAPVAVPYPASIISNETILLPDGGKSFFIVGDAIDTKLAGLELKRSLSLRDGTFTMAVLTRSVVPEITLANAMSAAAPLKAVSESRVYLVTAAPAMAPASSTPVPAASEGKPAAIMVGNMPVIALDKAGPATGGNSKTAPSPDTAGGNLDLKALISLYGGDYRGK